MSIRFMKQTVGLFALKTHSQCFQHRMIVNSDTEDVSDVELTSRRDNLSKTNEGVPCGSGTPLEEPG